MKLGAKITPGYEKYIVNKRLTAYHCGLPMKEGEIKQVFSTLDINENEYITSEEVEFFMNIIGIKASRPEIQEMIRMLDING